MTARCGRTTWKSSQTGHFNVLDRLSDAPRFGSGSARPHDLDQKGRATPRAVPAPPISRPRLHRRCRSRHHRLRDSTKHSLQVYWFGELGQSYRYWLALGLRLAIFFTLLISIGTFIGYNLRLLCRTLPAVPPTAPWFAALVLAALIGFGATTLWAPLLGFLGTTGSGPVDPVFGKDIAFYLLVLPWYDAVVALVITALVMTIALWALIGLAFYPSTGRPWHQPDYRLRWSGGRALRVIDSDDAESWTESEMVWRSWLRQGLVLAALFCVAMGLDRFLGRYHLVIAGHSQSWPAVPTPTSISGCRHTTSSSHAGLRPGPFWQ
jgi:hypothetical protein